MNFSKSAQLFHQAQKIIPGGVNSPVRAFRNVGSTPLFISKAKGAKIFDEDGNTYLDYVGTWGPAILGHSPTCVRKAIQKQIKQGISYGAPHLQEIEMAKIITEWVPSIEKVRMVNSGTEATMSAIRLARAFTRREKIIKFAGCYHGHADTLLFSAGSGALTHSQPDSAGVPKSLRNDIIVLPFNDIQAVEKAFQQHKKKIAAIILEPYPANTGLLLPKANYLKKLRNITQSENSLLIFDEVMTGFRLAKGGVQEITKITPDLSTLGKIIGGGLPVGAFGGKKEIMDILAPEGPVYQAGTLSGNPLALSAGLSQLQELEKSNGWVYLESLGKFFENGISQIQNKSPIPFQFHRAGSIFSIFFSEKEISNLETAKSSNQKTFKKFFQAMLKNKIYLAPSPFEAGFLSTAHSKKDLEKTLNIIEKILPTCL